MQDITPKYPIIPMKDKLALVDQGGFASKIGGLGGTLASTVSSVINKDGSVNVGSGMIGGSLVYNIAIIGNDNANSIPSNLTVTTTGITTAVDGTQSAYVILAWTGINESNFDHYVVRYKKHSYTYYQYLTCNTNTITIDGLIPNVDYDFGIASVNKYGISSSFSADVAQTTASDTAAPTTVTAGSATGGIQYVILEWTHNSETDLASYNVYRSETNNSATAVLIGNCRTNYFVDGNRVGGTTYYYWVKAVDTSGNVSAAFSTVKSATPRNVTSDDIVTIAGSKVLIDGTVYLSNWRHGSDLTKIDGGDIYAGSVTTTQLNFTPVQSTDVIAKINASAEGITIEADNLTINAATTFGAGYNPTTKVDEVGGTYDSAASGARVRIFPDANTGIQVIDDGANDVFKCIVGGTNVGDVQIGNYASGQGALYDKSAGLFNFKGTIVAGTVFVGTDASLLEMAAVADFPPDTNLVGYWTFDEGSGTVVNDGSDHGNNGTIYGTPVYVPGKKGTGLDLDGSTNYIDFGNIPIHKPTKSLSISMWFKADAWTNYNVLAMNSDRGGSWTKGWLLEWNSSINSLQFYINGTVRATFPITDTAGWHHVVATYDKVNALITVDGVDGTPGAYTEDIDYTDCLGVLVGSYSTVPSVPFDGMIDEFRLYGSSVDSSGSLTQTQRYALYKNPGQGKSLAVPIGRLTSGEILSKQITLAGTNCYIAGGNSLDFTNWRGGDGDVGAVMLGIGSDSLAKFFAGDFVNHKYIQFDGTSHLMTGVMVNHYFGDGSDGTVVLDGSTITGLGGTPDSHANLAPSGSTYTLTRNIYCYDLTVNNGITVIGAGYRIFCLGTLTVNGTIHNNGQDGGNGTGSGASFNTGGAGGIGGLGAATGSFERMKAGPNGGKGGDGGTTAGSNHAGQAGGNGISQTYSFSEHDGKAGGKAGYGGSGADYAPGAQGTAGTVGTQEYPIMKFREYTLTGGTDTLDEAVQKIIHGSLSGELGSSNCGAAGGAGGGGNSSYYGASGGGGGGTGGCVYIAARALAGAGNVSAAGGKGGSGASSTNAGASGQGSGGNGGIIFFIFQFGSIPGVNPGIAGGSLVSTVEDYAWWGRSDYRPYSNSGQSETHSLGGGWEGAPGKIFQIKIAK